MELEGLRATKGEHSWANVNLSSAEETVYLLDGASESSQLVGSGSMGTVGNSIKLEITLIEHGR